MEWHIMMGCDEYQSLPVEERDAGDLSLFERTGEVRKDLYRRNLLKRAKPLFTKKYIHTARRRVTRGQRR